ncbi:acyltransferase family protein [Paracraurococcus ruber]|uniref:Acyltransferase 3 domain-containing protein n=1 Tax=Paracraurococcus ruber TaxID=77675 RepID=A0ABS1D1C3_9PROT|nr:acyltransferase family protein [Paracraurococcus ruber]MBK1660097.1 hypothetical protein [Paracraurococcus ruber]TDG28564.1 hypothetical protein E2C05_20380 [Paracraurococcus ruber]
MWVLAESMAAAGFSLFPMLAIGVVIGPHAAGAGLVAIAAFLVAETLAGAVPSYALGRLKILERRHARGAAAVSIVSGLAAGAALALLSPLLARQVGDPAVGELVLPLAPLLPLAALSAVASGPCSRGSRSGSPAARLLLGQALAMLAGLVLAGTGYGPWAMVAAQVVATTVTCGLMLHARVGPTGWSGGRTGQGWGPWPPEDRSAQRDRRPAAVPRLGGVLALTVKHRVFLLALGLLVLPSVLAICHFAFRLVDGSLGIVGRTVSRLGMPRLCALRHDRDGMAEAYGDLAQLHALLGVPICLGIALTAPQIVALLFGSSWAGMGAAAQIVAAAALPTVLHGDTDSLFVALGKARRDLPIAVAALALPLLLLVLLRPQTPEGAALVWAIPSLILPPVLAMIILGELNRSPLWLLRRIAPALLAGAALVLAVLLARQHAALDPWPQLITTMAAGAVAYCGTAWIALRGRFPWPLSTMPREALPGVPQRGQGAAQPAAGWTIEPGTARLDDTGRGTAAGRWVARKPGSASETRGRQEGGATRVHALDSLRGIAALSVVIYHGLLVWPALHETLGGQGVPFFRTSQDPLTTALLTIPPSSLLWRGREAVLLFFVLSGYVLAQALLRGGSHPYLPFVTRRACRLLLPCVAVALPVALLVMLTDPVQREGWSVWVTGHWDGPVTMGQVLSHALLLDQPYDLNSPLWSLHYEWRISLVFPLLLALSRFGPGRAMAASLGCLALGAAEMRLLGSDWLSMLVFVPHFMMGIVLARDGAGWSAHIALLSRPTRLGLWAVCYLLLSYRWIAPGFALIVDLLNGLGAALLIALVLASPRAQAALAWTPLAWLGKVSFSLYLVHVPVLLAALHLAPEAWPQAAVVIGALALSLPLAAVLYSVVERPTIQLGRHLTRRRASPRAWVKPA